MNVVRLLDEVHSISDVFPVFGVQNRKDTNYVEEPLVAG